ncbi:MAG: SPOR domain-containing protein [Deltaproteobacteria bacterium]|nr:SPOR domain-containing protein [Deltaproteobacteria bacterium]
MLKNIFLGPGRVLCGRPLSEGSRGQRRYRLSSYRSQGAIILISVFFWAVLVAAGVTLSYKLGTNVDPPPPKPRAEIKPRPATPTLTVGGPANASASLGAATPVGGDSTPVGSPTPGATPEPAPVALAKPPEAWLVIVESIPKTARQEAERSLARHKKKGVALDLLDTDAYPKLKSGLWALAMGPYDSKKEAETAAATLKPKVKGLMVRRGL